MKHREDENSLLQTRIEKSFSRRVKRRGKKRCKTNPYEKRALNLPEKSSTSQLVLESGQQIKAILIRVSEEQNSVRVDRPCSRRHKARRRSKSAAASSTLWHVLILAPAHTREPPRQCCSRHTFDLNGGWGRAHVSISKRLVRRGRRQKRERVLEQKSSKETVAVNGRLLCTTTALQTAWFVLQRCLRRMLRASNMIKRNIFKFTFHSFFNSTKSTSRKYNYGSKDRERNKMRNTVR